MKRAWYYPPFRHSGWGIRHGSAEGNICTWVIGTPLTGYLVVPRSNRACLDVDKQTWMAYVSVACSEEATGSVRTVSLEHGINLDFSVDTGELFGVEIDLTASYDGG